MSVDLILGFAPPLVVRRRRGRGFDRAYVRAGQRDLGFRELVDGAIRCDRPADAEVIEQATAAMFRRVSEARRVTGYQPRHSRPESPIVLPPVASDRQARTATAVDRDPLPDHDLADNRPPQGTRDRARELRDAAPVRTFFARTVRARTDERTWRIGADGEDDVVRRLSNLGDAWHVLHAVPIGDPDREVDHVAIGPAGVFTIIVRNHPGARVRVAGNSVKIDGTDEVYVRTSKHEAARAALLLSRAAGIEVTAQGLCVLVGVKRAVAVDEAPKDVTVLRGTDLTRHLGDAPRQLDEATVAVLFAAARRLSTWQPRAVVRPAFTAAE